MSPVSRGRKGRKKSSRSNRRPAPVDAAQELRGLFAGMLRPFRQAARDDDPLDVEVLISGLVGAWWGNLPPGEDPDRTFGLASVQYARDRGTPDALAFLRALAAVAGPDELRAAAAAAAGELAGRGVAEPVWAGRIGRVEPGDCWQMRDVYGDQTSLLCTFGYGGDRHAVLALVDFTQLGGGVKDVFVADEPEQVLAELRQEAAGTGLAVVEPVDPAQARRLLDDGFAATDRIWQPELPDSFRQFRALALARTRLLPASARKTEEPAEVSDVDRDAIVQRFLAAPHAAGLSDRDTAGYCARLIVDFGCDYDSGRPQRVSPAKTELFLLDWLPRKVMLDDADRDAMPAVVRAWVRWAGEAAGLPAPALAELTQVAEDCAADFAEEYDNPANAGPARKVLQGLDTGSLTDLRDAVDRRMFTMPYFGTRIGDEDYPDLDPGDPDERGLLIQGEHPEYHQALDDPSFDGEIDGVSPRLHIAIHEIVANQLWEDDPPEAWEAAKRLRAAGVDRHDILHAIADAAMHDLHAALIDRRPVDVDAYRGRLAELQPEPPAQSATPAADTQYRLKIGLRGAKPPIWRRLQVPAAATLADLHHVIQVAFGWQDSHLHEFEAGRRRYAGSDVDGALDEAGVRLAEVAGAGGRLRYTYDFGDDWEHDILVEEVLPAGGPGHAVCVAGRRAGPPEDCGGIWGHAELCAALADPGHPDHADRLDWLGGGYDPAAFDKDAVNRVLQRIPLGPG